MTKILLALTGVVLLCLLTACAAFKEPPSVIYPDRNENPNNYKIDVLS